MMQLLAARIDRSRRILVNARLDGYPAYFYIDPAAVPAWLQQSAVSADEALALLQAHWERLAPALEKQVRRHGNDFVVTTDSLDLPR
ncbi:hypothetical protein [Paludibacterium purpuratum]|uniref:Uncharacterized protein n=1 Tax=Paludibacterium purpuratum TaxID=1144873 RepID=A0A4R7BC67_9NEIS|nr:hypothetical protein [Paludibacterium purpuratum]TDR82624.1 hypothetical protein DFP86_1019 [Paludibacterium purpuratum]